MAVSHSGLKLCLAATSGGHLREIAIVAQTLETVQLILVTVASPHSASLLPGVPTRTVRRIERNPANLLINAIKALHVLLSEKPDAIVSTGAGDVVPLMILGSALGIPVVFVESIARVHKPSLTGRIVRPFADLVMIPWPSLETHYPGAVHISAIRGPGQRFMPLPSCPSVLILTGTGPRGFNRLLRAVDELAATKSLPGRVFAQIGESTYLPENCRYSRYLSHRELTSLMLQSDLVITHDGAGSIVESLAAGKPTIVVPRRSDEGELTYKSDTELAAHLASLSWILLVDNPTQIPEALGKLARLQPSAVPPNGRAPSEVLRDFLRSLPSRRCMGARSQLLGARWRVRRPRRSSQEHGWQRQM